ncbi:hypothetical protein ACF3DV_27200 [Chlorogloeopsis fritschii PCC 9212]|nr:hypothetical protein [Chlorogloeopsis fritschii]
MNFVETRYIASLHPDSYRDSAMPKIRLSQDAASFCQCDRFATLRVR